MIINSTIVIATLAYLTTCCNCNEHNLLAVQLQVIIKKNVKNGD